MQYVRGPIVIVQLIEDVFRLNPDFLQIRKNGSSRLAWVNDSALETRRYEIVIPHKGEKRTIKIQFVYDNRSGYGKIEASTENDLASLFRCIPDITLGISELHVGEAIKSKSTVIHTDSGLAVAFTCPFCKAGVQHICEKK